MKGLVLTPLRTRVGANVLLLFVLAVGCTSGNDPGGADGEPAQTAGSESTENRSSDELETIPTQLPGIGGTSNCTEHGEPAALCDWIGRHDAVVVGKITDIRLFDSPVILADRSGTTQPSCRGDVVSEGVVLELEVLHTLHGTTPSDLQVRVGPGALDDWYPRPMQFESDKPDGFRWMPSGSSGVLEPGMVIGVGVFEFPDLGLYSSGITALFSPSDQQGIFFQNVGDICMEKPPLELQGVSIAKAKTLTSQCSSGDGAQKRAVIDSFASQNPSFYTHAVCFP